MRLKSTHDPGTWEIKVHDNNVSLALWCNHIYAPVKCFPFLCSLLNITSFNSFIQQIPKIGHKTRVQAVTEQTPKGYIHAKQEIDLLGVSKRASARGMRSIKPEYAKMSYEASYETYASLHPPMHFLPLDASPRTTVP